TAQVAAHEKLPPAATQRKPAGQLSAAGRQATQRRVVGSQRGVGAAHWASVSQPAAASGPPPAGTQERSIEQMEPAGQSALLEQPVSIGWPGVQAAARLAAAARTTAKSGAGRGRGGGAP